MYAYVCVSHYKTRNKIHSNSPPHRAFDAHTDTRSGILFLPVCMYVCVLNACFFMYFTLLHHTSTHHLHTRTFTRIQHTRTARATHTQRITHVNACVEMSFVCVARFDRFCCMLYVLCVRTRAFSRVRVFCLTLLFCTAPHFSRALRKCTGSCAHLHCSLVVSLCFCSCSVPLFGCGGETCVPSQRIALRNVSFLL